MPHIRVFDLGDVLLLVDDERFFERVRPRCREGGRLREALEKHYDRSGVDRGRDFGNFYRALVSEVGLEMTLDEFEYAWSDIFTSNPPMLEVVQQSPRPRFLLSNTNEPHVTWVRERYPEVFPLFDACVLSNEVGLRKPEVEIYRHVETLSGERPERHVFIDDLEENVEAARAAGWQGIRFEGVEDCLRKLAALESEEGQG